MTASGRPGDTDTPSERGAAAAADEHQQTRRTTDSTGERLVYVYENAPDDYTSTCLRPLGLCELGGCCDTCWYNPFGENSLGKRPDNPGPKDPQAD